jgi:hypothetical protein
MNNSFPFKTPEQSSASNDDSELIREYFQVVHESFVLLHKFGFASDPGAILAALGMTRRSAAVEEIQTSDSMPEEVMPVAAQAVNSLDTDNLRQKAQADARRTIDEMTRDDPYAPAA